MSRRRTLSDEQLIAATARVIGRVGPARLTLADVAKEAGLAPATLLQRFGSKRGLLLEVARAGTAGVADCFAQVRAAHRSALNAIFSAVEMMAQMAKTPEAVANHLAFLQIDLTDPEFHRLAVEHSRATEDGYRALLEEAVAGGELVRCDTARLARVIGALGGGSMLAWAIRREGPVAAWLRRDLETVLRPLRVLKRASASRGTTARGEAKGARRNIR
jgi:AcrR family transcriptional regulator